MVFDEILATIENDDIREFASKCIEKIDPWFWVAPAASSGRHHPITSLGEGGLLRHTLSVVRFLNYILEVESVHSQFTSRERDLMRVAAMLHDVKKSGSQDDYETNKSTKFEHPLLAANFVRSIGVLPKDELELCASMIESHMGQFNTSKKSDIILPKPTNKYQILVHVCDYISSRKDIEVRTDMLPEYKDKSVVEKMPQKTEVKLPDINTWRFTFGKKKGMTIPEVAAEDPGYIMWAKAKMETEPARTLLKDFEI